MQIWLGQPRMEKTECLAVLEAEAKTWTTPIVQYLEQDICKLEEEKTMK